jgi:hypothetical protein
MVRVLYTSRSQLELQEAVRAAETVEIAFLAYYGLIGMWEWKVVCRKVFKYIIIVHMK